MSRHDHLRANPQKRRTAYWILMLVGLGALIAAIIDIFVLDAEWMWPLLIILFIVILLEIILFFSRRKPEEETEYEEVVTDEPAELNHQYLRCQNCAHVISFEMQHLHEDRHGSVFTCPECGLPGRLPRRDEAKAHAVIPGGASHEVQFGCGNCGEHFAVGSIGHDPKAEIKFDSCPHCGVSDQLSVID